MCDCNTCVEEKDPEVSETWELYHRLDQALRNGHFGKAFALSDALCVPEKAKLGLKQFPSTSAYASMSGYSKEHLQCIEDRIEQYNSYAAKRI